MELTDELRRAIAPSGTLRAALNHGNRVLVARDSDGAPRGITVDLATELAACLQFPLEFVHFDRAGDVSAAAATGVYDVCFLAVDPERATVLHFTDPYIEIEGRYLAGPRCRVPDALELVGDGCRVATVEGSAYTLDLSRKPGADRLVRFADFRSALAALDAGQVDALAGIGAVMAREAASRPESRVLDPPFMMIRQAMALPAGNADTATFLRDFIARLTKSGRLAAILSRHGIAVDGQ